MQTSKGEIQGGVVILERRKHPSDRRIECGSRGEGEYLNRTQNTRHVSKSSEHKYSGI